MGQRAPNALLDHRRPLARPAHPRSADGSGRTLPRQRLERLDLEHVVERLIQEGRSGKASARARSSSAACRQTRWLSSAAQRDRTRHRAALRRFRSRSRSGCGRWGTRARPTIRQASRRRVGFSLGAVSHVTQPVRARRDGRHPFRRIICAIWCASFEGAKPYGTRRRACRLDASRDASLLEARPLHRRRLLRSDCTVVGPGPCKRIGFV